MAKRPYDEPVSRQQKARTSSGLASLLWMLVGAVLAVMIGVFLYLSPLFNGLKTDVEVNPPAKIEPLPQQQQSSEYEFYEVLPKREFQTEGGTIGEEPKNTEAVATTGAVKPDAVVKATNQPNTQSTPQSTENAQVAIVEENDTYDGESATTNNNTQGSIAINSTNGASSQTTYILQVRSYDNPEDADRMRAEVMLSGVDARILKRVDNEVVLYQVISQNMNAQEVKSASQRLRENGIDSIIVEQRH